MAVFTLLWIFLITSIIISAAEKSEQKITQGSSMKKQMGNVNGVTLFEHKDFKGENLTIVKDNTTRCFNFHRGNTSSFKFNNFISSFQLQGNISCIYLYDSIGCFGDTLNLTEEDSESCAKNLDVCGNNERVSSVRFCDTDFPELYNQSLGVTTRLPCQDGCNSYDGLYFYCQLQNGSKDYCSPRPGTDPFGYDCDDNCSNTTFPTKPLLFEEAQFRGHYYEIDDSNHNRCINIRYVNSSDENFDNKASAVDIGQSCLILHEQIGCTGKQLKLSLNDNVNCHVDLTNCEFNDKTTSVSFCDSKFHRKNEMCEYQTILGECCVDKCETRGKPYFWCNLKNKTWDYCFPREGMDFLGNECDGTCALSVTFPQSVTLYEGTYFNGKKRVLSSDNIERERCQNFPYTMTSETTLQPNISSVHLDSSCVRLYDNIGCTGNFFELTAETEPDCWKNVATCNKYTGILSAQLCSAHLPTAFVTPIGSRGSDCFTQCHPRDNTYFWCVLQDGSWDYCIPRPEADYFGNDCGNNCEIEIPKVPGVVNRFTQIATLYLQEHFQGKFITINSSTSTECFNLDYNDQLSINFNNAVHSIEIAAATCVLAYSSASCTGTFTVLSDWDNKNCLRELERCDWSDKVSSISFCRTISASNYTENSSSPCIDDCTLRGKPLTMYHVSNGSWNYYSLQAENPSHHPCAGNCSNNGSLSLYRQVATLYLDKHFEGTYATIDSTSEKKCFSLEYNLKQATSFYKTVLSISMNSEACLLLYNNIGCAGNILEVSHVKNAKCLTDLEVCSWHSRVSSISFCNVSFPPHFTPGKGNLLGDCYRDNCETLGSIYFYCITRTGWDFCSLRPGLNYMGEDFKSDHSFNKGLDSISLNYQLHPVLYDEKEFSGNYYILEDVRWSNCLNFWHDNRTSNFHKNIASVDLKWNCLVLFEEIGCTGDSLEIFPDDTENYHRNLEAHGWSHRVSSISLCDAYLPPKFSLSNGSRGEYCMDACESRGRRYFWCHLESGEIDLCLIRPGQDYFGRYCGDNCSIEDHVGLNALEGAGSRTKSNCTFVLFVILMLFYHCVTFILN